MSATKHTSFIFMSPELLPRQKLKEVVTVPELFKGLAPKVDCIFNFGSYWFGFNYNYTY